MESGSSKIKQDILETFSLGKKSLSISDISRLSGHHRHTVARYLDNLVLAGKLEMRQHGQKKKYYLPDIQPDSSILNFSPHMLIILNMDLSIRWANESFLRMINSTIEAISNLSIEALHVDDLFGHEIMSAIRNVRPGETRTEETRVFRDDKEMIFLFTISAVSFFQDRPALVITGEDITEKKALLDAIKTSESNLRLITESVRDLIIRWESNGTISYVSPACELLTGYVSHELLGKNISDFIHPEDLPPYQHGDGEKNVNWSQLSSSFRFRTLKGKWIWFETTTTPRLSESGEIVDYISVWRDITAWLEAETRLALSEEKYRRLFEGAKDAIILMELTDSLKSAKFREVNTLTCELFGYTFQEFLTLTLSDIIPPSMREYFEGITEKFMQDEQGFFEIELLRKDGTVVPVEVNAHLFSLQGRMLVLAITRDITERRKHQAALMEAHQRLVDILEFLPDPVFVIDIEGKVTAWNRAMEELTGKRKEEIVGKGDYACAVAFYHQKRPVLADYILHRDETVLYRYNNPKIDGDRVTADVQTVHPVTKNRIWLWIKAAPIYNLNGTIIGVIETLRDISDRKTMELEIRKQNAIFEALSRAASDILQSVSFEDAVLRTIRLIGEATSTSRVCLLEKAPANSTHLIKSELEWNTKTGIAGRVRTAFSQLSKDESAGCLIAEVFAQKKTIHSLVRDLRGNDRRVLEDADVKSILFVPIKIRDDIWGVVGFLESTYERIWSQKEIRALEIGSSLIGSARMRFEAGERLEKSEKQFRTLAQNIPGIVFRLSLAGSDMEFYNDHLEAVTGYTARELASGQISSLIPLIFPDDKPRLIQAKIESIRTGEPYEIEYRIIDKFGHIRVMSERGRPVTDETGLVVSIDGIIQEVKKD